MRLIWPQRLQHPVAAQLVAVAVDAEDHCGDCYAWHSYRSVHGCIDHCAGASEGLCRTAGQTGYLAEDTLSCWELLDC
jgi:hypothetical protein